MLHDQRDGSDKGDARGGEGAGSGQFREWLRSCEVGDVLPAATSAGVNGSAPMARVDAPSPELAALTGKWLVVHTKGAQEWVAAVDIAALGCDVFLPWVRVVVLPKGANRRHRRRLVRKRPLFTSYLFARLAPGVVPSAVASARGVASMVSVAARILTVPEPVVAALRERCDADMHYDEAALAPAVLRRLAVGDRIEVVDGPFAGFVGQVEGLDGDARISAWFDIMGRATRVHLPTAICDKL